MVQEILTKITANGRGRIRRTLSATVALVLALAMVASAAFADAGRDPAVQGDDALLESSGEACGCGSISASANPSMEVALWYVQPELSFLIASRALRAEANPSLDVALWYAGPVLRAEANPSLDAALWDPHSAADDVPGT